MSLYVALLIGGGVVIVITLATYFFLFRVGKTEGKATARLDTAKTDLQDMRKADAIVTKEVSKDDLQKSLRDGSF